MNHTPGPWTVSNDELINTFGVYGDGWFVADLLDGLEEALTDWKENIGQLFESDRYSPREAVSRMNDMRDYLKSEISAQIQELRTDTYNPTKAEMIVLLQSAIKTTFKVFEEEA